MKKKIKGFSSSGRLLLVYSTNQINVDIKMNSKLCLFLVKAFLNKDQSDSNLG